MKSKPNVLQLIDSFHQGGTERQAVQLTRLLHESGRYRVHVACLHGEGVLRDEVERLGLAPIVEFPLTSFYNRNAAMQSGRFARLLREREIDLVHVHDFYTNIFGMSAAALARVPVRIASRRETDPTRSYAQRWTERRAYNLAHAIVANAEAVRRQLISEGVKAEKIVTLYNGMDTKRIEPRPGLRRDEVLAALNLPREENLRFVTIVANMRNAAGGPVPYKDQPTFLRAARHVQKALPDAVFVLAGEGELLEPLSALAAELGLARRAFFIGRCGQVADLLAVSDVCVLSSRSSEGFANSIIEYMAAARPVVATDVGGAREQIVEGETGYVVPPGDDVMMAERIISLLGDPERARQMGERGLQVVTEKFSCAAQLARTETLYERLLAHRAAVTRSRSAPPHVRHEEA